MSLSATLRAASSYAKFGAGEMVARLRWIVQSHLWGLVRNATGENIATGNPKQSGVSQAPMRPMS